LTTPGIEAGTLCAIEAELAKAQKQCTASPGDSDAIVDLFRFVANDWKKQGNTSRADALYCGAYREALHDGSALSQIAVLRDWAFLAAELHDVESAKELALRQVALARDQYQSRHSSQAATMTLIDALDTQATIFERLNDSASAFVARDEAQRLSAQLPKCNGVCGEEIQRIDE
jgi:hypothetical protein